MANTLTALAPVLYEAAHAVSNEPFGVVNHITVDFDKVGVAKGDNIVVPVAPIRAATDFTPANVSTAGDNATASNVIVQITQSKKVSWHLTGEQIRSLDNATVSKEWIRQLIAQGIRTLRNLVEADACLAIKQGASRAVISGTLGTPTVPFATDLSALTGLYKLLKDNGAPMADLQCVFDTGAGLNLRNLGIIQNAYQAGTDAERRNGSLLRQFGFELSETAGIVAHTKGTNASAATIDATGYVAGSTALGTSAAGTGTIVVGDVVTFAGDTNNYVVNGGVAAMGTAGVLTLARPGLKVAMSAATKAITVGSSYTPHLAFERSAVVGVYRPPLIPENPTINQLPISDSSGLTFLLLDIAQYGQRTWELHIAYGNKVVQPEHVAILMGA